MPDGKTVAWMNGGTISQNLGVAPKANTSYTLDIWVGRPSDQSSTSNSYTVSLSAGTTTLCTQSARLTTIPIGTFIKLTLPCPAGATPSTANMAISLSANGPQAVFDNLTLTTGTIPPQSVNLMLSGSVLWDDNTPIAGTVQVQEQNNPDPSWHDLTTFTPNGSGIISGIVSISTNYSDAPQFLFLLKDAAGNVAGVVQQSVPGATFKVVHSVTGFKLIINKASCAATQCTLSSGSTFGTLGL